MCIPMAVIIREAEGSIAPQPGAIRWVGGDTLVIDTVSVRDPQKFFFAAPTLSEEAHYVERLHMTAPDRIESEITIEDPATLGKLCG